jgi:hypothetical protein
VLNGKIKTKNHTFSFSMRVAALFSTVPFPGFKAKHALPAGHHSSSKCGPLLLHLPKPAIFFYIPAKRVLKILSFAPTPRQTRNT